MMGPVHPLSEQDSDRGKNLCKTAGVIREIMHRLPECNIAYPSWFPYSEKCTTYTTAAVSCAAGRAVTGRATGDGRWARLLDK